MATRSYIGVRNSDDTVDYIYCHYDGYPSNNGKILIEYYNDPTKVSELLSLGDLSVLAPAIGEKHDFVSREARYSNWSLEYGRDRGDPNTHMKTRHFSELVNTDRED